MYAPKAWDSRIPSLLLLLLIASTSYTQTWQSDLVQINTETGVLSYTPDSESGIQIPDFSTVGYKGGGIPIPDVLEKITISPVEGDNTVHIQNAIDYVGALPMNVDGFRGSVLLNPGVYPVSGTLQLNKSGVVLRGSGRWQNTSTSTHIIGINNNTPERSIIEMGGLNETAFSAQPEDANTIITSPIVPVGAKHFKVEDSTPFQAGDNIIIYHPCTAAWLEAINGGGTDSDPNWTVNSQPIIFNTRIVQIKDNVIFTNSPVFNTLDRNLSQAYIYKLDRTGLVENVGVENLRIDIQYNLDDLNPTDHAKNAILIMQAENAWVKTCKLLHFWYAGVELNTVNYVTVEDVLAHSPKSPIEGGYRYNFVAGEATQNSLFTKCEATNGRHSFASNGASSAAGIVFHKCTSIDPHDVSEGHRRWTTGMLYDNFSDYGNNPSMVLGLYNRGNFGTGHGWSSANCVAWNCDSRRSEEPHGAIVVQRPPTAQNFAIGCKGDVRGNGHFDEPTGYIEGANYTDELLPTSLYEAQLYQRTTAINEETTLNGLLASIYDNLDFTGNSIQRIDPTINFDWGKNRPDPSIEADKFSIRWEGQIEAPVSGVYTFYTYSDDGVRLWVDDQFLIDEWVDQGPTEHANSIFMSAGQKVPILMEYYENGRGARAKLYWSGPENSIEIIPSSFLFPPNHIEENGLKATIYDNMDFTGLTIERVDPTIDFSWGTDSPDPLIDEDQFSVRWEGQIKAPTSGTYTFYTYTDDGVRLWIDDQLLIDRWIDQGPTEWANSLEMNAGEKVAFKMEYYENGGSARARLYWSGPGINTSIIPSENLFIPHSSPLNEASIATRNSMTNPTHNAQEQIPTINIYPNPSATPGELIVNLNWPMKEFIHIRLMNAQGQKIYNQRYYLNEESEHLMLPLTNLPHGVYFIQISGGQYQFTQQLVFL